VKQLLEILKKHGLKQLIISPIEEISEASRRTSQKIHISLAMRLEKRGMIREAIQIYRQAAKLYPVEGYKSIKLAAELAEKNSLDHKASALWFESIFYAPNFYLKLKSLAKCFSEYLRSKI
jgi:hypothetical protein